MQTLVALPVEAREGLFAVRAHGASMDGGKTPIRDGDWCVMRWMRGASVEALRDRVVLVQTTARDEGARYQLKRLVERDGAWWFVSDGEGPSFAATADAVVIARLERVVTPESLAPAVGTELEEPALAAHFGWDAFARVVRRDGHRFAWIEGAGAMRAPDRVAEPGDPPWPGETSYVFTRANPGAPWRFKERTVSRTDLGWTLLAADDVARNGGVLDEARVHRLRYLDGTPKDATRWIDTGWAIRLWRLAQRAR